MKAIANKDSISEFYELIMAGIDCWVRAGQLVTKQLEADPTWADNVNEAHPEISIETIYAFDRIGRGILTPRLLISDSAGYKALRRQPISIQETALKQGVSLLVYSNEKWSTLNVDPANLTPAQCRQVFDGNRIRTEAAQRAWLESQNMNKIPRSHAGLPYRIVRRSLVIQEPCQITAAEIAGILAEMEK